MPSGTPHPPGCDCPAYACGLRRKSVAVAPSATPSQHNRKPSDNARYNGWERGIAGEQRAGGAFMPYLTPDGTPMGIKPFTEKRHKYNDQLARIRAGADSTRS